jgi:hypothetical protein
MTPRLRRVGWIQRSIPLALQLLQTIALLARTRFWLTFMGRR